MSQSSPYASAANVPLIKNPSVRLPKPVELPQDIHPLPDSVTDYFVYPYTLEPHIITLESSRRSTIAAHAARREAYLRSRDAEKEQRKRDALRRIAPGFEPYGGVLMPTKSHSAHSSVDHTPFNPQSGPGTQSSGSVMSDLVDQLAALDSRLS